MSYLSDVIKVARDYDASRPRSVQVPLGWSEVGGCRSYMGFRLGNALVTDETDTWSAQRGTAIHDYLQHILAGPGVRTEVETAYRGIPGHADLVDATSVVDIKTTRLANSGKWAREPAVLRPKRIQVHGYCAGLVDAGELPEDATVRLLVVPADGTYEDWWCWEEPFDRSLADEGADRLEWVRAQMAAGEPLPKDEPYYFCSGFCEFFALCRGADDPDAAEEITDPEIAAAVAAYGEASAIESAAKKDKEQLASLIRGLRGTAGDWRISLGKPGDPKLVLNEEAVRAAYEARGEEVPESWKPGSSPRLSVTRIRKKDA